MVRENETDKILIFYMLISVTKLQQNALFSRNIIHCNYLVVSIVIGCVDEDMSGILAWNDYDKGY